MLEKESSFPHCWRVSSLGPVFNNAEWRHMAKIIRLVSLISVLSKIFEKHGNNSLVDHLKKCSLFF